MTDRNPELTAYRQGLHEAAITERARVVAHIREAAGRIMGEAMRAEAAQRRANRPASDNASLIDDFNATNPVAAMLEMCGYEQSPRDARDWRSPLQTGETYATRVMDGGTWFSLSQSDTDAGVGQRCKEGCFGDAYDLYAHFKHGGDHKAAYREIGAEQRGNVIRPSRFNTPDWMKEVPLPDEMPDYVQDFDLEPDHFAADLEPGINGNNGEYVPSPDGTPRLPFFWFNDAVPNLEANDFVEDLLTTGSMSVVYGPSNCGKTFFIVDLALHVAWGREWRGRAVDKGAVVYLSLEGAQGIRDRHGRDSRRYRDWRSLERLHMTSEPIDRNKPQGRPSLYGFPDLAVGESVDVPVPTPADVKRMCTNASQYGRRHDRGYRCKTDRQTRVMTITRVR